LVWNERDGKRVKADERESEVLPSHGRLSDEPKASPEQDAGEGTDGGVSPPLVPPEEK